MSADKTTWSKRVQEILSRYQAEQVFSHAYASAGVLGAADKAADVELTPDGATIFDLASTTKALVTTPLMFQEKRLKGFSFDLTVGDWLGSQASDLKKELRDLSLRSLLRHESGLPAWHNFWICHLEVDPPHERNGEAFHARLVTGLNRAAERLDLNAQRNRKQVYSDVGFLLLGFGLERLAAKPLNEIWREFCTTELNGFSSPDLGYGPELRRETQESLARFVPTAYCALRHRELRGEVHDENCASFGGVTSHSGLFGSGRALNRYLKALSTSPTGALMLRDNASEVVFPLATEPNAVLNDSLLGMRQGSDAVAAAFGAGKSMGHYGFTGTAFWIEPAASSVTGKDVPISSWRFVTLLTNRVRYGRLPVRGQGIGPCRKEVFETTQQLTII